MRAMRLPHRIALPFPRRLAAAIAIAHGVALSIAPMLPIVWPWRASLVIGILLSFYAAWRQLVRQKGCQLTLGEDGTLKIGDGISACIMPHAVAWSWLIVLPLHSEHGRATLLVTSDMLSSADWRVLVAWVRWQAAIRGADDAGVA